MKPILSLLVGLTALSLSNSAFSQSPNSRVINDPRLNTPAIIAFPGKEVTIGNDDLFALVNSGYPDCRFSIINTVSDDIGFSHSRFKEYYKGVEVIDGEYLIHRKGSSVASMNGKFYPLSELSVIPKLNEATALSAALSDINAEKYKWQMPEEEQWLQTAKANPKATWKPKGSLVIIPDLFLEKNGAKSESVNSKKIKSSSFHLAWKFDVYADSPLGRYNIYVDATTGKVLFKENRICTTSVTGTAVTKYSGTQQITTDSVSPGVYNLRDMTRVQEW